MVQRSRLYLHLPVTSRYHVRHHLATALLLLVPSAGELLFYEHAILPFFGTYRNVGSVFPRRLATDYGKAEGYGDCEGYVGEVLAPEFEKGSSPT